MIEYVDDDYESDDDASDELMDCPNCRESIHDESVQCPFCGHFVLESERPGSSFGIPRTLMIVVVVILVVLLLLSQLLSG